jgi:type IV pilus biogenesis protein CpaD/CtpE
MRDLEALREATARAIPDVDRSMKSIQERRTAASEWKERLMPETVRRRPWLATAALAGFIALILSVIPISYTRVVGADVTLHLGRVHDPQGIAGIAREMKSMLKTDHVEVKATPSDEGLAFTFEAFVPASAGVNAAARSEALAKELTARGFEATAMTATRREKQSGNVYAFARDLVVKIETEGKTASQIESEIQSQLAAAGIQNAEVSVKEDGNRREVRIQAQSHGDRNSIPEPGKLNFELTKNGVPVGKDASRVEMRREKSANGETLHMTLTSGGRTTNVQVPNADTMSDAELASRIRTALQAAGIDVGITVEGGRVQVEGPK